MKKVLAIALAAALLLGVIPCAGAAFTDAERISEKHREAVTYVSERKVISGFPDGSFKPAETLTRAQAAKILCAMLEGADKANALTGKDAGFADVPASHWAAKFIAYCAEKGIVAGVGNGKFNPDGALTAAAFAKMLLVAYGEAKPEELTGSAWAQNTRLALRPKLFDRNADSLGEEATTRENACRLAYNFMHYDDVQKAAPEEYKETTITFKDGKNYRLLGRAVQDKDGVVCDWSADGVEFTLDCKGTVNTVRLTVDETFTEKANWLRFRVEVDGKLSDQVVYQKLGEETIDVVLEPFDPGVHTIRIVKDLRVRQSKDTLKSITLLCKPETMQATQPKKRMIQIIGDSTTQGAGIMQTDTPETTKNSTSATLAYGYLIAQALDADYEMVVRGSLGVIKQAGKPPYNQREMYEYQNRWRDTETKYSFPRKADAVVIKISGNDQSASDDEWRAAMTEFITTIRRYHGENMPIVFFSQLKLKKRPAAEALAKELPNVHMVAVQGNADGMGGHSSGEAHQRYAREILEVLLPILETGSK